jgi:hypothetical protein
MLKDPERFTKEREEEEMRENEDEQLVSSTGVAIVDKQFSIE